MAVHDEREALMKTSEKEPKSAAAQADEEEREVLVAEGVPLHSLPAAVTAPLSPWSTGLCACLGNNDEFFSSDLEVCVLGTCAPCLLYASNVERLHPTTENTFTSQFLMYSGLLCLGNLLLGYNVLAPCFSCSSRTGMRKRYNLMGSCECFARSCGCGECFAESSNREGMEALGDLATHCCCHLCALCQEGREMRRRMPHPGFIRSYTPMNAPTQQVMSP